MGPLRRFLTQDRRLALALVVLALALRAMVPPGFMVGTSTLTLKVEICADASARHLVREIVIPRDGAPSQAGEQSPPCAFSSLLMAGSDAALSVFVAAALAFVLALGFAPLPVPCLRNPAFPRPPLRAPPAPR